jgi:hypothetical protein
MFLVPLPIGDATGLRGTFPGHPRPFHLTFTDIHNNIYTPMGTLPDGTRTRADLAVVAERVLILPSTTLPSAPDRHTHTSMAGRRFLPFEKILPLRWDSNPLASGPRPRSTFSDSHAATELPDDENELKRSVEALASSQRNTFGKTSASTMTKFLMFVICKIFVLFPSTTRRHVNFAGVQ